MSEDELNGLLVARQQMASATILVVQALPALVQELRASRAEVARLKGLIADMAEHSATALQRYQEDKVPMSG